MFYEEIRTKQKLSYISMRSFRIFHNSKFILMATPLGTNNVVVTRVHCSVITTTVFYVPSGTDRSGEENEDDSGHSSTEDDHNEDHLLEKLKVP